MSEEKILYQIADSAATIKEPVEQDRIFVKYGETVNTGDYNSKRYDISISRTMPAGANLNQFCQALWAEARQQIHEQIEYDKRIKGYLTTDRRASSDQLRQRLTEIMADQTILSHHSQHIIRLYEAEIEKRVKKEKIEEKKQRAKLNAIKEIIEYAKGLELEPDEPFDEHRWPEHIKIAMQALHYSLRHTIESMSIEKLAKSSVDDLKALENVPF